MKTSNTPPITGPGTVWAMKQIVQHFDRQIAAASKPQRKPKAEKADPFHDEPPRCHHCKGDEIEYVCQTCANKGVLNPNEVPSVYMTVYREDDEVHVQCTIQNGRVIDAWIICDVGDLGAMPRWANGESIELTLEEQAEALEAIKR